MKQLHILSLRKNVTFFIVITMFILLIVTIVLTNIINKHIREEYEKEHIIQVEETIKQVINHYIKKYSYITKGIIKNTNIIDQLKIRDYETFYEFFKPKWELMRKEEPFLRIINLHLSDESSFLRMHSPEMLGDNLTASRAMIKEVHLSQKIISGFETGKYNSLYRIVTPVFDSNQTYIGAIEFGLNPDFIINELKEINNINGLVFIKNDNSTFFDKQDNLIIDEYKLLCKPTGELKLIAKSLTTLNYKENDITILVDKKRYQAHIFTLNDFKEQPKVKIVILHSSTELWSRENSLLVMQSALIFISLILLTWFIYRYIYNYEKNVKNIYKEQIKQIQENLNDGILLTDVQSKKFLTGNTAICRMLGYELQELKNMSSMDIYPKENMLYILEQFNRQIKQEIKIAKAIPIKRKDGTLFYADINSSSIVIDNKNYLIRIFRDITEQKQLLNKLELNQTYLQKIIDEIPSIVIVTDGKIIIRANRTMLKFTGFNSLEEFKQKHDCICDFFVQDNNCIMSIINGLNWLDYILSKPSTVHEACMINNNENYRFIIQAKPLSIDENFECVVTFTDITEIEKIKKQLNNNNKILLKNEKKFKAITDSALDAIIILDNKDRLIFLNPKADEMLGYNKEELMGEYFHKIVTPKAFHEAAKKRYEKFTTTGNGSVVNHLLELSAIRKGGMKFPISLMLNSVQIDEKWHTVGFIRDITEHNKLQNKLKQKDQLILAQSRQAAMGELISMIAHQWRQPITAIGMGAQNLQLDIELEEINPKKFDEKLAKIIDQTHFLSKTIDDFRDFLKPNKKPEISMLSKIAEDALNIVGKSLENDNITLNKLYDNDSEITTFKSEVVQVLLNIINNSKDVIQTKKLNNGTIWLKLYHDEEMANFEICDNAGGIPEDIIPRIFEPYFTTKEEKGGTGLGLYMSQMIIKKHLNGTISIENRNEGACFTVSIPLKTGDKNA